MDQDTLVHPTVKSAAAIMLRNLLGPNVRVVVICADPPTESPAPRYSLLGNASNAETVEMLTTALERVKSRREELPRTIDTNPKGN